MYSKSVNCSWDEWETWGDCSISCGEEFKGTKIKTRAKVVEEKFGGICDNKSSIIESCPSINITCPRSCEWNEWSDNWGECSVTCGKGEKTRNRTAKLVAEEGGTQCINKDGIDVGFCELQPCPGTFLKSKQGPQN